MEPRERAKADQDRRDGRMGKEETRDRQMAEQLPADQRDEWAKKELQVGTVDDKQDMNGRAKTDFPVIHKI
jgi:hypothetical protein